MKTLSAGRSARRALARPDAQAKPDRIRTVFRHLLLLIPAGVIFNLLLTASTTDFGAVFVHQRVALDYLILAVLLGFVPWFTHALRLRVWTRFLGARIPLHDLFSMVIGTELGSAITPTAFGGGYVKLGMLVERGLSVGAAASLMTLGSVEDGVFFAFAIPVALVTSVQAPVGLARFATIISTRGPHIVMATCCAVVGAWIILTRGRKNPVARRVGAAWSDCAGVYRLIARRGKTRLLATLTLTAIQWACRYSVVSALLASFSIRVDPSRFFVLQWVVFTLGVFVPSPGAAGGLEAAFMLVHRGLIPESLLGLMTAGWRLLTFYLQLSVGSLVFGVLRVRSDTSPNVKPESGLVAPVQP
ncbi:MAG: flippase-like domain-containing protein [Candidatus Eisenbacteria bacterium]|jgi:uncharacterized protein (TIRG00374 family)|nr:flippase-like domain-containing protein [Candidatus Eisenbacteria bacterium]